MTQTCQKKKRIYHTESIRRSSFIVQTTIGITNQMYVGNIYNQSAIKVETIDAFPKIEI